MMKKLLCIALSLIMVFSCAAAMAASESVMLFGEMLDTGLYIPAICGEGNDLYAVVGQNGLYLLAHWQPGMPDAETWDKDILWSNYYPTLEDVKADTGKDYPCFIDALFIKEGNLYTVSAKDGSVYQVTYENQTASYAKVVTLDWARFEKAVTEGFYIKDVKLQGDQLYLLAYLYNESEPCVLMAYDFSTGKGDEVKTKYVSAITPYKDGKLIAAIYDEMNNYDPVTESMLYPTLQILDPKDGSLQKFYDCTAEYCGGIQYDANTDELYFTTTRGVEKMTALGTPTLCAYIAASSWGAGATALMANGLYAYENRYLCITPTDPTALAATPLNVMGVGDKARYAFSKEYPGSPVLNGGDSTSAEEIVKAGMAKDASIDIFCVSSRSSADAVIDKGYALDLSGSAAIRELVESLHPALQKMCMRDGKIYCIPTNGYAPAFCYNDYVYTNYDLPITKADVPTNFLDFLGFIKTWYEDYADDCPDVLPFDSDMFYYVQNAYINYYAFLGEPLTFDTELFRSLLNAYAAIPYPDPSTRDEDYYPATIIEDAGNPIEGGCDIVGMSLTKDTPYVATLDCSFLYVNANSRNPDLAIKLLEHVPSDYNDEAQIVFFPDRVDGILQPNAEQLLSEQQRMLDLYKAKLETCEPDEKADIETSIGYIEKSLENPDRFKYIITPKAVARFRELVKDNMIVQTESVLYSSGRSNEELYSLQERFQSRQITVDEYIAGLERIVKMIQMEQ